MSALFSTPQAGPDLDDDSSTGDAIVAGTPVVVRRRAGLAALIGAAASAVAIAYLWRASQTMTVLDWSLCAVMALVAAYYLSALVDARTPLAIADDLGVRIRLGDEWRGLPWDGISQVVVRPRRGLFRDGRIVFAPNSLARAIDGLEGKAKRHAVLNQKMYGAALAVPVGVTTRISTSGEHGVVDQIAALSLGRAEVIEVGATPDHDDNPAREQEPEGEPGTESKSRTQRRVERREARQLAREEAHHKARARAEARSRREEETAAEQAAGATGPVDPIPAQTFRGGTAEEPAAEAARDTAVEAAGDTAGEAYGNTAGEGAARTGTAPDVIDADSKHADRPSRPQEQQSADLLPPERPARPRMLGGIGRIVSRVGKGRTSDRNIGDVILDRDGVDVPVDPAPHAAQGTSPPRPGEAAALSSTRRGLRAEITRDVPATLGNAAAREALDDEEEGSVLESHEPKRPGSVDLGRAPVHPDHTNRVRPISKLGDPVEPLVIDDFVTEPAYNPVIGPELTAARTRLGLSVDELADRTRIRPHVIESIEVDDFAPCGGDFYARGHLRTLARVLGKDPAPLMTAFEDRYATAPVNARRVFEAELATGMRSNLRGAVGGPNWGLLIGVVLCLVLVWGVVRFFSAEPAELVQNPAPVLNGSAGLPSDPRPADAGPAADPLPVTLVAADADSPVVVRNGAGRIMFSGDLELGERQRLRVSLPVRIRASDGGGIEVSVRDSDKGPLGVLGDPVTRTFR